MSRIRPRHVRHDPISRVFSGDEILKSYRAIRHGGRTRNLCAYGTWRRIRALRFSCRPTAAAAVPVINGITPFRGGSAGRKYNAVNVIYRINHDLLCDPGKRRAKFHRKSRVRKPYKHNNESFRFFFSLVRLPPPHPLLTIHLCRLFLPPRMYFSSARVCIKYFCAFPVAHCARVCS